MTSPSFNIEPLLAMMVKTDLNEQRMQAGSRYAHIFKRVNIRRTEICVGVYTAQIVSGVWLVSYGVYFFERTSPRICIQYQSCNY